MYKLSKLLAGPVLRRVEPSQVNVWLALPKTAHLRLRVFSADQSLVMEGECQSHAIGAGLHVALVQAKGTKPLHWGQLYEYELDVNGEALELAELLYPDGPSRPSFVLPGATLDTTRILHGSCRHPTNRGADALALLDDLVERALFDTEERPQLFVCSGDLIYADSPSPFLLAMVTELGDRLLGYRETLPSLGVAAAEISVAERHHLAEERADIYAGTVRQIFGLGEFLALHLLSLSPGLWPEDLPADLQAFCASLSKVRRALANTAFYAIFDDHEITDDWYLTQAWSERVLAAPLGRRMIANGLAAFAVVHACGNTPEQFEEDEVGHEIFQALCERAGVSPALEALLGIPETANTCLTPPPGALRWHFRLQTPVVDLRALDTRTMRAFPAGDAHAPPDLLSDDAIAEQLGDFTGQAVLVVPAPMAPPPRTRTEKLLLWIDYRFTRKSRVERLVYLPDRGDEWQPSSSFYERVLDSLPPGWVCLGGDTHLAYAAQVEDTRGVAAIFCSSGMLRETVARRIRQTLGFSYPWPLPRNPVLTTARMTLRYLRSDPEDGTKRYQYLSKNNIGELRFEDDPKGATAKHCLWWQDSGKKLRAVRHSVVLHSTL